MKTITIALLFLVTISLTSCNEAKDSWVKAIKDCGLTDINSDKIFYFGPSNNVGPGSVWRETVDQQGKHLDYRLRFSEEELPNPKDFVQLAGANSYQCKSGQSISFKLSGNVSAGFSALPLNAEVSNDLKRAKSVNVSIGGMAWDQLRELEYETYFKSTVGAGNKYYEDLNVPGRLVLYRALAVRDLVMSYEFSVEDAAAIKGKYKGPLGGVGIGDIGGGLSANWKRENTLTISAPQKAWILGELAPFQANIGFAGRKPSGPLTTINIEKFGTPVVVEKVD